MIERPQDSDDTRPDEDPLAPPPEPPPLPEEDEPPPLSADPVPPEDLPAEPFGPSGSAGPESPPAAGQPQPLPPPPAYPPPGQPVYQPPAQQPPPPPQQPPPPPYQPPPQGPPQQPQYPPPHQPAQQGAPQQYPPQPPPPHQYAPPQQQYAPPQQQYPPPPPYAPSQQPSPYAPPGYPPPPPYQPPPPKPRGPHGQPMWRDVECASWGSRVGAYLLDLLFASLIPVALGIALAVPSNNNAVDVIGAILIFGGATIGFPIYAAILVGRSGAHNGQTWGKQIVGIRVVRDRGEPLGFWYAMLREFVVRWLLIGFIGGFFFFPPLLDLLWPLWDESNRALHDMVVSTHVVRATP